MSSTDAPMPALPRFTGDLTRQEPLPPEAIDAVNAVLESGRLHRYEPVPGEESEVAALEREYADWQGRPYCLALASGGQALQIALRAVGVRPGDPVLANAFTLAPVPGAIAAVGAEARLVEINEGLVIDLDDLARKADQAKVLMLSHMRGHQCDMDALMQLADEAGLTVIEDCAHTMGATWRGIRSGNFGRAGCFSTQSYKHLNSGEGGLLTSADPNFMARAILLSGAYMLYERHGARPPLAVFNDVRLSTPNMSARMDNVRAAMLRPQLPRLESNIRRWNRIHDRIATGIAQSARIHLPRRAPQEGYVGSSLQFAVPGMTPAQGEALVSDAAERGVALKWFGASEPVGYTSNYDSWTYLPPQLLPQTRNVLDGLIDLRLPLTLDDDDCDLIAAHIRAAVERLPLVGRLS